MLLAIAPAPSMSPAAGVHYSQFHGEGQSYIILLLTHVVVVVVVLFVA